MNKFKSVFIFAAAVMILMVVVFSQHIFGINMPDEFVLQVPFSTQAPNGDWTNNENCEETSAIMANAFLTGNQSDSLGAQDVSKEIHRLTDWEQKNIGHSADTGVNDTAKMIEANYDLKTKIVENFSEEDIKKALLGRKVVIMFADGTLLNNPNYSIPYHVFVIRGYNKEGFISNDPGTNEGKNFVYPYETINKAAADWDQNANSVNKNRRAILIVSR